MLVEYATNMEYATNWKLGEMVVSQDGTLCNNLDYLAVLIHMHTSSMVDSCSITRVG